MGPSDLGKLVRSYQGCVMGMRHDTMHKGKLGGRKIVIDFTVYMQKLTLYDENSQGLNSVTTNMLAGFHSKTIFNSI